MGAEDGINGFVCPSTSGWYPISIDAKDSSFSIAEKVVDFSYVRGGPFGYFDVTAAIRNFEAKNLFTFRFYLPTGKTLPKYADGGRIYLEFSTRNEFS